MKTGKSALTKPRNGLSLDNALIRDTPGRPQTVVARIKNTTSIGHEFFVEVVGLGSRDTRTPPTGLAIEPGGTGEVELTVHIPEKIASGCHLLAVRAWAGPKAEPEIEWYTELKLTIADGSMARIEVEPTAVEMHRHQTAKVHIENLGKDTLEFSVSAEDPEGIVNVKFWKPGLVVEPRSDSNKGIATTEASLTIDKLKFFGDPILRVIDITADGQGATHSTTLRIQHRPYIPMWVVKLVGTAVLVTVFVIVMVMLVRTFIIDNPAPEWRELEAPLDPRAGHTALWVEFPKPDLSNEDVFYRTYKWARSLFSRDADFVEAMIVWGGGNDVFAFDDGAIYLVGADEWRMTEDENRPIRRLGHTAVWTEHRMIIWGGRSTPGDMPDTDNEDQPIDLHPAGGAYDPQSDSWAELGSGELGGREQHTAVWVDDYGMIVWGGTDGEEFFGDGGVYCDELDGCLGDSGWEALPAQPGAPSARAGHIAVWTGTELIIWGGYNKDGVLSDGAAFDPKKEKWEPLSGPPSWFKSRAFARAVWTDDNVAILGGIGVGELNLVEEARAASNNGGMRTPEDIARRTALSTDTVLRALQIIDAGASTEDDRFRRLDNTVALYDAVSDSWEAPESPPPTTSDPVALWTGARLRLVFGVPEIDTISSVAWVPGEPWKRLPPPGPNEIIPARTGHTAVWIRGGLVVWGGRAAANECPSGGGCFLNDGGVLPIAER